jgi:4-carboxymuconolactone decarboxylase
MRDSSFMRRKPEAALWTIADDPITLRDRMPRAKSIEGKLMSAEPDPSRPEPRLPVLEEHAMTEPQRQLLNAIKSGPRGQFTYGGPFAVYLHAPEFGVLAQELGAFCRYKTKLPPRLSEFAILVTAQHWQAQYEWHAHAAIAARAGVRPETIEDLRAGRVPNAAPEDERALYDFITDLYATRRVSNETYARVNALLGDAATVEFVGLLGYYALVAMTLNVFRMLPPAEAPLAFKETAAD